MKFCLLAVALVVSVSGFAAEKCRDKVIQQIKEKKSAYVLKADKAILLAPGKDGEAYGGEYWNDTNNNVEVYFASRSDEFSFSRVIAIIADAKTCRIENSITLNEGF